MVKSKRSANNTWFKDLDDLFLIALQQSMHVPMPVTAFVEFMLTHDAEFELPHNTLSHYLQSSAKSVMKIRAHVVKNIRDNISVELTFDIDYFIDNGKTTFIAVNEIFFTKEPFNCRSSRSVTKSTKLEHLSDWDRDEVIAEYKRLLENSEAQTINLFTNQVAGTYDNNIQVINLILSTYKISPDSPKYQPIVEAFLKFSNKNIMTDWLLASHSHIRSMFKSLAAIAQA